MEPGKIEMVAVQGFQFFDVKGDKRMIRINGAREFEDLLEAITFEADNDCALYHLKEDWADVLKEDVAFNENIGHLKKDRGKLKPIRRFPTWLDEVCTVPGKVSAIVQRRVDIVSESILADITILEDWRQHFPVDLEVFRSATISGMTTDLLVNICIYLLNN
jgi:hypothetical protein